MRNVVLLSSALLLCLFVSGCNEQKEPTITEQPQGATYQLNAVATPLSVAVENINDPVYQWYANTSNSNKGGVAVDGATANTYVPPTNSAGTTYYYCVIGELTSEPAGIIVNGGTSLSGYEIHPGSWDVTQGSTAPTFWVSPSYFGAIYQWYSNTTDSNSGGTEISGATTYDYRPPTDTAGTTFYYCVVDGTTASSTAVFRVVASDTDGGGSDNTDPDPDESGSGDDVPGGNESTGLNPDDSAKPNLP